MTGQVRGGAAVAEQAGLGAVLDAVAGGVCRFCRCTDSSMGRDDRGGEAEWATLARDVCTKPQCQAALLKETRTVRRSVEAARRDAVRPIRSNINRAEKRKRERRERRDARRNRQ